jgi:mRNA-degrading endonuclease RelE of RelBE toxin-antitoxin system
MTTRVEVTAVFTKALKRLSRKYPSIVDELDKLITRLEKDERPGDKIPGAGYDVYKVRLANPSARRGKRGGFRIIYYIRLVDHVVLLTIYSKSEQSDIALEQLRLVINEFEPPPSPDTNRDSEN